MNNTDIFLIVLFSIIFIIIAVVVIKAILEFVKNQKYKTLLHEIQTSLGLDSWRYLNVDDIVSVKSARSVDNYQPIQYFKDNRSRVSVASFVVDNKIKYANKLTSFLNKNDFMDRPMYPEVVAEIKNNLYYCNTYRVKVRYISPAGKSRRDKIIEFDKKTLDKISSDPTILMSKTEYNQYIKNENKNRLEEKQHTFYDRVNDIIDFANEHRDIIIIKGDREQLDKKVALLFDRTVNSIKKIKNYNSEEWTVIDNYINSISDDIHAIVQKSNEILEYYNSPDFAQIKTTCESLLNSQKEFNDYIKEKAQSIATLFGTRVTRSETEVEDTYNYVRPYKKSLTPFTAEVSAQVFASAENNPLEYVVKYFYTDKSLFPTQIQKLQFLIEELETLKEAKGIIDNYKKDYQQYITNVPDYVMKNDEDGFYSRLGFANVSESALTVEYMFSYTSNGGMAQRTFTIPMTEETIVELIKTLQSKLTMTAFAKEQRTLMTSKLRMQIKERDHYTCKNCGNSTDKEPNLLLEIDHIIPVSKGGTTEPNNLQTLCWKCNRSKSDKVTF